jgi:hypothetical protein
VKSYIAPVVAILATILLTSVALGDDVTSAIAAAGSAYGSGDYKAASTQLQTALVAVNQLLIDRLVGALPDPPAGWTAEDPEGVDASAIGAGFFATLVVDRRYTTPDGSVITLSIAANSPMLAGLRMFVSNPMMASMAGQSGMKSTKACGYDALEQFKDGTYEMHVLGGNATLISATGSQASDEGPIRTLINATDCATIVSIVE